MTPVIGKMGTSEITKTGLETGGLPEYVKKNKRCSRCKKTLSMTRGKSGKVILWCKDCHKSELLPTVEVNQYICMNHIWCPEHKCHIEAKVGSYGLYIKCDAGHSIKPEYI
jgi:hypothetical protein